MDVVVGTNHFIDCSDIFVVKNSPLLRVNVDPLRVTVVTPPDLPSGRHLNVVENVDKSSTPGDVRVVAGDKSVAIYWREYFVLLATLVGAESANVQVDFRPLGINVYVDPSGLHVGQMHFAANTISNAGAAFNLG